MAADEIARSFARAIAGAPKFYKPYRHWLLADVLPPGVCEEIAALPIAPAEIEDTAGKRDTNNFTRVYFDGVNRLQYAVCENVAQALQGGPAAEAIEREAGVDLSGSSLRIEYCQDRDGFWLEPHTDIGVKKLTLLVYLSDEPGSEDWGTDLMSPDGRVLGTAPYRRNAGLMFVPGPDTWHGFKRRPIGGVRKSIIVNYVGPEWRARHELAFPDRPLRAPELRATG